MREIKFRAWHKEQQIMFPIREAIWFKMDSQSWVNESHQVPTNRLHGYDGETIELMQYTGLKDKNGKEIYEGDIFEIGWRKESLEQLVYVDFDKAGFVIRLCKTPANEQPIYNLVYARTFEMRDVEVIGNIYENPELLLKLE